MGGPRSRPTPSPAPPQEGGLGSRCRPRARLMPRRTREPRPRPPRPALSLGCHARGATRLGRAPGNNEPLDARTGAGEVRDLNLPRHDLSPCGQRQPRPPPHSVNRPGRAQACPLLKFTPRPPGALPQTASPFSEPCRCGLGRFPGWSSGAGCVPSPAAGLFRAGLSLPTEMGAKGGCSLRGSAASDSL